ncbi:hypothetical protein QMK33_20460 [Hymenobacter sp. H14-R3]|uniref:hypothetical protein n=1 Tax=Hymenobacter sp. H14-R3 TaxID=3046308 RepID=UPI0024B998FE|nr:hypothetical protein [Hymenobacter sp. H14-R3]MDJ0367526.1 hypothetical protein [Hymenobacter sp. H14-R3]
MALLNLPVPRADGPWLARYHGWLLLVWWAVVQAACWHYYQGPRLFGDGAGYLDYARHLAETNTFASGRHLRYVGYSTFLSVFLKLGLGMLAMGLAQVALSGLAACAFYATAKRLCGGYWPAAALATLLFVSWPEVQAFNAFILTESLFTSLLLFALWALVRVRGAGSLGLAVLLLGLTSLVRPNGFIALLAAVLAGLAWLHQAGWPGRTRWVGLLLLLLAPVGWLAIDWLLGSISVTDGMARGVVICNYPPSALPPPATLRLPAPALSALAQLGWFVVHNFRYFSQVAVLRLVYFLGFPKPWHSVAHMAWAGLWLPLIYGLASRGMGQRLASLPIRIYLAACLLLQMAATMLTFEDWDVRFSGPLLPYWLLLATLGAYSLLQRRQIRRPNRRVVAA